MRLPILLVKSSLHGTSNQPPRRNKDYTSMMPFLACRDSQLGNEKVHDISNYILKGKLWEAFDSDESVVLLIDEIAQEQDIEFPNDLLLELDKMEFYCYETQETIKAKKRPIVIITSNNEKVPDAFLRDCLFHFIRFLRKSR